MAHQNVSWTWESHRWPEAKRLGCGAPGVTSWMPTSGRIGIPALTDHGPHPEHSRSTLG